MQIRIKFVGRQN